MRYFSVADISLCDILRDGVALCDWAAYMEKQLQEQHRTNWTEISAAELLRQFRLQQENSRGESFGTISAYGANGAIIHYAPTPETDAQLGEDSLYMVDSGGQYLEGTTDVTRTFHYGLPTAEMVTRYTEVLAGSIDLANLVLPDNTLDYAVDLATRLPLFRKGSYFTYIQLCRKDMSIYSTSNVKRCTT